jgi:hypothetical protein
MLHQGHGITELPFREIFVSDLRAFLIVVDVLFHYRVIQNDSSDLK